MQAAESFSDLSSWIATDEGASFALLPLGAEEAKHEKIEHQSVVISVGSAGHALGKCKPCAFIHREQGCQEGESCRFCHLCKPGEKKRRQKQKFEAMRLRRLRRVATDEVKQVVAVAENETQTPVVLCY